MSGAKYYIGHLLKGEPEEKPQRERFALEWKVLDFSHQGKLGFENKIKCNYGKMKFHFYIPKLGTLNFVPAPELGRLGESKC